MTDLSKVDPDQFLPFQSNDGTIQFMMLMLNSLQLQQWRKCAQEKAENFQEKFARGWVWWKWKFLVDYLEGQDLQDLGHRDLGCEVSCSDDKTSIQSIMMRKVHLMEEMISTNSNFFLMESNPISRASAHCCYLVAWLDSSFQVQVPEMPRCLPLQCGLHRSEHSCYRRWGWFCQNVSLQYPRLRRSMNWKSLNMLDLCCRILMLVPQVGLEKLRLEQCDDFQTLWWVCV